MPGAGVSRCAFLLLTWEEVEALPATAVLATDVTGGRNPTLPLHMYEWTRLEGDGE